MVWLPVFFKKKKARHNTEPDMSISSFLYGYSQYQIHEILKEVPHETKLVMLYKLRYLNIRLINIKNVTMLI